jgi:predicted AlkP superfamily phosphohydrolase/phosphomutase
MIAAPLSIPLPDISTKARNHARRGARANLESTIPSHSWAAWSTFMTGLNPGGHDIYDLVERHPTDPGKRIPVSSRSLKAATFFERLSEAGRGSRRQRSGHVPTNSTKCG